MCIHLCLEFYLYVYISGAMLFSLRLLDLSGFLLRRACNNTMTATNHVNYGGKLYNMESYESKVCALPKC